MRWAGLLVLGACGFNVPPQGAPGDDTSSPDAATTSDGDTTIDGDPQIDAAVLPACASVAAYANSFGGSGYRTATANQLTYDEAATECASDGGRLAVIESLAEHDHIAKLVNGFQNWSWIGLTDRMTEGTRVWITGVTLGPSDFQVFNDEIDDDDADCYNLSPNPIEGDNARWGNYFCDEDKGWVCECDVTP